MSEERPNPWKKKQEDTPPDLEEVLKSFLGSSNKKKGSDGPTSAAYWPYIFLSIVTIAYALLGFYVVHEPEKAVVTRFGALHRIESAGLHWRFWGMEDVFLVDTQSIDSFQKTNMMLTKDENIVFASFEIQYRRSDPFRFLFADEKPIYTLQQLAESSIRDIIGHSYLEDILTTGKDKITQDILRIIKASLEHYDIGLEVIDVNVAKLRPPPPVQEAFNDVIKAREDEQALQNKAKRYRETHLPIARGQAERVVFEADTFYKQRVTRAQGETEAFNMLLMQYKNYPDILKTRLYFETIDEIYAKTPKMLLDADVQSPIIYGPGGMSSETSVKNPAEYPSYTVVNKDKK